MSKHCSLLCIGLLFGLIACGKSVANTHFSADAFTDMYAHAFAQAVVDGNIHAALTAASKAPGGVNTLGTMGETGLLLAVERLDQKMVTALLNAGADPNGGPNMAPLHEAVKAHDITMAKQLLAAGADPNGQLNSEPALYEAALIGNMDSASLLLAKGARIDEPGPAGETPAICAAGADNWQMTALLISAGASLFAADSSGFTIGAFAGHSRIRQDSVEGTALTTIVDKLKAAGSPWPPPSPAEVRKLQAAGKWPPAK